jgi:polyribonucleotide nucleotidyltransferase
MSDNHSNSNNSNNSNSGNNLEVLEKLLQSRIDIAQEEISTLRNEVGAQSTNVKNSRDRLPKRHKESLQELLQLSEQLERNHSVQAQNNASERAFMREMNLLKQKRKEVIEYNAAKAKLDAMRDQLTELIKERGDREASLEELYAGTRRVRAALKCNCDPSDIEEVTISVPVEKIASIIGRGGTQMKLIENVSSAMIDIDRSTNGSIRLVGTTSAITAANAAIQAVVDTTIEEWDVSEEAITCLLLNRGELITEIQDTYNVKIDTSKAKKVCKITGLDAQVQLAKQIIKNIDCRRVAISFTPDLLPLIVGKGGSMIKSMEDECGGGISIDIERDSNTVVVQGYRSNVDQVASTIRTIISENKEIEDKLAVNKQFIFESIIGIKGAIVRDLQKELGVGLQSSKIDSASGDFDTMDLTIRGPTNKVIVAKSTILRMWQDYLTKFTEFDVPLTCVPLIVGKKGSKIKTFRDAYPNTQIHIDDGKVRLHGDVEEDRLAIKAAIEAIVDENYTSVFTLDPILAVLLKSGPGASARESLQQANVFFEIDASKAEEDAAIELRGSRSNVESAVGVLTDFVQSHYFETIPLDKEDIISLSAGNRSSPDSFFARIEKQLRVSISIIRKTHSIRVFGSQTAVADVSRAIHKYLTGHVSCNTAVVPIAEDIISAVVGKGGSTINNFQKENNVKVDILKSKGALRIELCDAVDTADAFSPLKSASSSSSGTPRIHDSENAKRLNKALFAMKSLIAESRITVRFSLTGTDDADSSDDEDDVAATTTPTSSNPSRSGCGNKMVDENVKAAVEEEDAEEAAESTEADTTGDVGDATTTEGSPLSNTNSNRVSGMSSNGRSSTGNKERVRRPYSAEDARVDGILKAVKAKYDVDISHIGKSKLSVRGKYYEVKESVASLKKSFFQTCSYALELSAAQLEIVKHSAGFRAVQSKYRSSGVTVEAVLLVNTGTVTVSGPVVEGDRAKADIYRLLDTEFPSQFMSVVMPLVALKDLGSNATLLALEQTTSANLRCDKDCCCIRVRGSVESVSLAIHLIQASLAEWNLRHKSVKIEEFLLRSSQIPSGSKGSTNKSTTPTFLTKLTSIEKATQSRILVNRAEMQLDISAEDKEHVDAALGQISDYVTLVTSERYQTSIPVAYIGAFIGKEGSKLKKVRDDYGVDVEIDKAKGSITFYGPAESMERVQDMMKAFLKEEHDRNYKLEVLIPMAAFPLIIGAKGATVKEIQEKSGCKLDLNRDRRMVVLRGR